MSEKKIYTVDELAALIPDFGGVEVVVEARGRATDYYGDGTDTVDVRVRAADNDDVEYGWPKSYGYGSEYDSATYTVVATDDEADVMPVVDVDVI